MHNDFDYGQNTDGQDEFPMRTGSGLLIGFSGRSGLDIDSLSPVFIRPLKSSHVENTTYPNLGDEEGLELKSLKQANFSATGDKLTYKFENSEESDFTSSWNFELSTSLGIETTFSAGIPGIESIGLTASWSLDAKTNRGSSETTKSTLTFSLEGEVSGHDTKSCTAEFWKGDITTDWTGTMVITTETDKVYSFPVGGRWHRVDASEVKASCRLLSSETITSAASTRMSSTLPSTPLSSTLPTTTVLNTGASCVSAVAAPTPTQPGVSCQCTQFYKVRQGDTCASVAAGAGLGLDQFDALNPEVGVDCQLLFLDYYVCVGAAGYYF
ncbi:hypothetical protein B0O99DRAFT_699806 [Bisporella sp. PMI_857]|nr:hypothetical protein B0O99DRAFT_699806 [Bisporella sp. PMI_857]